jgi:hypothetical protein
MPDNAALTFSAPAITAWAVIIHQTVALSNRHNYHLNQIFI